MATAAQTKLLTAEEFMAADLGGGTFELVRGEIVEMPPAMPMILDAKAVIENLAELPGFRCSVSDFFV
jgi:hypothetical protein